MAEAHVRSFHRWLIVAIFFLGGSVAAGLGDVAYAIGRNGAGGAVAALACFGIGTLYLLISTIAAAVEKSRQAAATPDARPFVDARLRDTPPPPSIL